ncbi:MAG TPA: hypothetical protein VGV09_15665 [Steroidobacteraceae bacterium]|nr:hypothetical protein [Steroidobacteraceae bacterium]
MSRGSLILIIAALAAVAGAQVAAGAEPSSAPTDSVPLEEVTVTAQHSRLSWAQRNELVQKAATFVFGITALENGAILPRWHTPVCPLVSGLSRDQEEFVRVRISQITQASAAPVASEHCRPTLFIYVTTHPQELLRAMQNRYFAAVFGNASTITVNAFIDSARPVRVWYNAHMVSTSGALAVSRSDNSVWGIGPVTVVADARQLQGLTQGQFADYVAMMSLAEIKHTARLGDAQTILKLFDGPAQAAPGGMSDWDHAFLKMLYTPERSLASERANIARRLVRDLVP